MKTKSLLLTLVGMLAFSGTFAQLCAVGFKSDEYTKFRASKTYFIKSGDEKFDKAVVAALQEIWKVTPFDVIDDAAAKTKITDPSASFLSLILIGEPNHGYHYLAVFNGGKKKLSSYEYTDMVCYSIVNRWVDEFNLPDCAWRVRNMIESMVKAIDIVQAKEIKGNSADIAKDLRAYYNSRAKDIPKRTLLVSETSMGRKFKKEEILGNYPYKIEVCPRSKIEKAIADRSTEYYYLQPGITLNKSWFVIDPSNGDVLYFNFDTMGMNITDKNIQQMVDDIKGK